MAVLNWIRMTQQNKLKVFEKSFYPKGKERLEKKEKDGKFDF